MAKARRRVWVGLAVGVTAALIPLAVVYACTPSASVNVNPTSAAPGTQVMVTINQIANNAPYTLSLANVSQTSYEFIHSGVSPATGSAVSIPATIPSWAAGPYYFKATITNVASPGTPWVRLGAVAITASSANDASQSATPLTSTQRSGVTGTSQVPPAAPASSQPAGFSVPSGPALSLQSRVLAREAAPALDGASQSTANGSQPAIATQDTSPGNPAMTGLAIGAMTLAIGLPLVFGGFATASFVQRRTARATSRKREE